MAVSTRKAPHLVVGGRLAARTAALCLPLGEGNVTVEAHGNSVGAAAFLQGLATDELTRMQLDTDEPRCELLVAVRAVE